MMDNQSTDFHRRGSTTRGRRILPVSNLLSRLPAAVEPGGETKILN
jgi:hypothetical protein